MMHNLVYFFVLLAASQSYATETKVLLFGDSGTGSPEQYKVANAMTQYCMESGCEFALMLGDNIYENGVNSLDDSQFDEKFEAPYAPLDMKFYGVLGNHDTYSGDVGIQSQIAYTNRSEKWRMYERYYTVKKDDVEFFAIDTNSYVDDDEQRRWLQESLVASTARWKVIFGHHTPYSVGQHAYFDFFEGRKLKKLREALEPLLCQHAQFYIGGHDHHLQVNRLPCGVVSVISGAAAKVRRIYNSLVKKDDTLEFAKGHQLGFAHAVFGENKVQIKILDDDGAELFGKTFDFIKE